MKTAGSLNPVCSGETKARAHTARWAGSAIAAERTKLCVQLYLGFSCRRYSEAPWSIVLLTNDRDLSPQGLPTILRIVDNVNMTLQLRILNSVSFYFCLCLLECCFLAFCQRKQKISPLIPSSYRFLRYFPVSQHCFFFFWSN